MNDYEAHAQALKDYEAICGTDVPAGVGANSTPCTVVIGSFSTPPSPAQGKEYPAVILPVEEHQMLRADGGGVTPLLLSVVVIVKADLPAGVVFKTGQFMYINPPFSSQRACKVHTVADDFTSWTVTLEHISEGV